MGNESLKYRGSFRQIQKGEDVKPQVANRPAYDISADVQYLKARLDTVQAGQALVLTAQTLGTDAPVGTPVYMDADGLWQPAQAEVAATATSTIFELTDRAYVQGMVSARATAGVAYVGDITIYGAFTADATILNVIQGVYAAGLYYLTSLLPGYVTASKGAVPVRVCLINGPDSDGNYQVLVTPDVRETPQGHGHYRIPLTATPAGVSGCVPVKDAVIDWGDMEPDGPYPGVVHSIIVPDSALPGWLPVDDAVFDNKEVPSGAKFGYNMAQDSQLTGLWPPMPLSQVYFEIDGLGAGDLVEVNSDGIWWMDNTYGHAPWNVNIQPCGSSSLSSSLSSTIPDTTPTIIMWFTRPVFGSVYSNLQNIARAEVVWDSLTPLSTTAAIPTGTYPDAMYVYTFEKAKEQQIWYTVPLRYFYPLQPLQGVRILFELLLANPALPVITETPERLLEHLAIKVSDVRAPALGTYQDVQLLPAADNTVYPVTLDWDVYPAPVDPITVDSVVFDQKPSAYYAARTKAMVANSGSVLYVEILWDDIPAVMTQDIVIFGVRPVTELVQA